MAISFDKSSGVFLLNTPHSTYTMYLYAGRYLVHGGWTRRITGWSGACAIPATYRVFSPVPETLHAASDYAFSLDTIRLEYPTANIGDCRAAAIEVLGADGTLSLNLQYQSHRIIGGKPAISGLPATFTENDSEADTLEIDLADTASGVVVTLCYTVWNDRDIICRHAVISNCGSSSAAGDVRIRSAMSANIDFWGDYRLLTLTGAWGRERHPVLRPVEQGIQGVSSRRGASSAQANPFMALLSPEASEDSGEVFGFNLVYSGNFSAQVERDQFDISRAQLGINPDGFEWQLSVGDSFCTPEVVMVYSGSGLGSMSRTFHDLYRDRLCHSEWKKRLRPIVINNWEATYFDFTEEKLLALADTATKCGIELFVLDDGWFGKRENDMSSLGDWTVYKKRLPAGLAHLAKAMHERGLQFGLWFEPEMVSPDSDLYRAHPDWALAIPGREKSLGRNQLVLDLSRKEVTDYLLESLSAVLSSAQIDYVKWDYNRSLSEVASAALASTDQLSVPHRYILGLYRLLDALTKRFPHILFESCSSGGGRFDPAMLYYMPQTWTSDNTDSLSRVAVQLGTSIAYPASALSCHVSAVPNHQVGRISSLSQRAHVAMAGTFGYELDLNRLSATELAEISTQVAWYKRVRSIIQNGDLYRLHTSLTHALHLGAQSSVESYSAWCIVAKDKAQALVTLVWTYSETNAPYIRLRLAGLNEDACYRITSMEREATQAQNSGRKPVLPVFAGTTVSARELMYAGLPVISRCEYGGSIQMLLEQVS